MVLLIYTTVWHAKDGLRVVIEDYVHDEGGKFFWLTLNTIFFIVTGALAIFSVLKIAFTAGRRLMAAAVQDHRSCLRRGGRRRGRLRACAPRWARPRRGSRPPA
jgi:hypothetical protein